MASATPFPDRRPTEEPASSARVWLQPIAAPSILGLYGLAGATFMVAANMAHWYGSTTTPLYLAPFVAIFGGIAQFSAGMWGFRARDGVATAMHGMWGSFWIAYGLLQLAFIAKAIPQPGAVFPALGYWFIVLAAITWMGCLAAAAENRSLAAVLGLLAAGSTAGAVGNLIGSGGCKVTAGYFFILSAFVAFYAASAMMLEGSWKRPILRVGKTEEAQHRPSLMPGRGEPGVIRGQ